MIKDFKSKEEVYKFQRYLGYSQAKLKTTSLSYRAKLADNETPAELHFRQLLDNGGYNYEAQYLILSKGKFYIADFYLPDYHLIVEIDGAHHRTHEGLLKDESRDRTLNHIGFTRIKRLSNQDTLKLSIPSLNLLLSEFNSERFFQGF